MNTKEKYILELRRLFILSVNKNINSWSERVEEGYTIYCFDINNYKTKIYVNTTKCELKAHIEERYCSTSDISDILISEYNAWFRVKDKEVYSCVRKLKAHFKQEKIDLKNKKESDSLKIALDGMISKFPKEYEQIVRKEKLNNLN